MEGLGPSGRFEIVASDISTRALSAARAGIYPAERVEGMDPVLMRKYLLLGGGRWKGHYQVKPEVKARVDFRRVNLVEDFSSLGTFGLIFCRNVMIYFDRGVRERLVARLADRLEPGGYLFVGHAESLTGIRHTLEYVRPAIYRKRGAR
jgi:chemotaxis protein methyltransferase CheR